VRSARLSSDGSNVTERVASRDPLGA